jgi:glycosyltransferase involved in cell wall biosynthesis
MKLAYFVSHPIQYQAPLLRRLAAHPEIDLTVFFLTYFSVRPYNDPGFGVAVEWDVPLLEGYAHEFLTRDGRAEDLSFFGPRVRGVPAIVRRGGWDAVLFNGYAHHALLMGLVAAATSEVPILYRSESNLVCTSRGWAKDGFIRWLVRATAGLLWIGEANREYYRFYGARPEQLFFVPYAVDNDFFREGSQEAARHVDALRSRLGLVPERPVILYASKLMRRKNPLVLLEAYARVRSRDAARPYLVFVGDGEERDRLRERVSALGLDEHVRFEGFRNQSELPKYFALCDLFVLPSSREPYGLIVNEVMNAGRPVITTDEVGAARDLVRDGVNGFVVRAGDVNALTQALEAALGDRARLAEMGRRSSALVAGWNYDRCVEGIVDAARSARSRRAR